MNKKHIAWILLMFTMFFWGMSFVWTRKLLDFFSPITIVSLRLFISTVFLALFSLAINKFQKIKKEDVKWYILLAIFQPFLYFICEGYGIKETSASFSAIVIATIPLFTPLAARIFFYQKVSLMNWIGLFTSFFGVSIIVMNKEISNSFSIIGIVYLMGAVFSAVGYLLLLKKVADRYNSFSVATWQNFFGMLIFLPFFLMSGINEIKSVTINMDIVWPILGLSFFASSLAFIFNTYGVRELGPSRAAAFTNSVPVFTLIFAFFRLGEPIELVKLIGMFTVLFGLFLAQIKRKPR